MDLAGGGPVTAADGGPVTATADAGSAPRAATERQLRDAPAGEAPAAAGFEAVDNWSGRIG